MKYLAVAIIVFVLGYNSFGQSETNAEIENSINELFESYAIYNRFIGSVLISQDNRILYERSFGYADLENHKKNTANSIFNIASVTKPLTAVGIMKLVEDGRLTLETSINTYFPNFIPDFSKDITVRHLLNHSSGMQANVGRIDDEGNGLMPGNKEVSLEELIELFKDSKLKFNPGTGYEYNNFGYSLLAYIIEDVSKMSYADYMEEVVFKPANMQNTAVSDFNPTSIKSYSYIGLGMKEFKRYQSPIHSSWVIGAGNIHSTTDDLHHFMEALENGKLLKPDSVDKLYSYTKSRGINDSEYGLGWRIEHRAGEKWINHTGLLPGSASLIGLLPERNIKIIILSNATSTELATEDTFRGQSQFVDRAIIDNIIAVLQGKNPDLLPLPVQVTENNPANYSRTYALDNDHSLLLTKQGNDYSLETMGTKSWSVFTYPFSRNAKEDNKSSESALFFAKAMSTQNFEGLSNYSNEEMKGFLGSEEGINQLKGMWAYFIEQAGNFKSYNIYKIKGDNNKTVHIRFHFEKEDIGFVLVINASNKIKGMFNDDAVKTSHVTKVSLIPVGVNTYFINGHQNNGMQDLKIKVSDKELILIDGNTEFKATILSSL